MACPGTPARPRWACCTSPTTMRRTRRRSWTTSGRSCPGHRLGRHGGRGRGRQQRGIHRRAGAGADAVRPAARPVPRCSPGVAPLSRRVSRRTPRWCTPIRHARPRRTDRRDGRRTAHRLPVRRPVASRGARAVRWWRTARAARAAGGVFSGGLSGVAFGPDVALVSRVTQGCQPVSAHAHHHRLRDGTWCWRSTASRRLMCCCRSSQISAGATPAAPCHACAPRWSGLMRRPTGPGAGPRRPVRHRRACAPPHRAGPGRHGGGGGRPVEPGMQLAFCQRDVQAARRDLVRICAEIRDELESWSWPSGPRWRPRAAAGAGRPRASRGAVYVSCAGRGGPHFGGPSAELQIVRTRWATCRWWASLPAARSPATTCTATPAC
jgi:hypothetical protein